MKFLPVKCAGPDLMRQPVQRLSLKNYIEDCMIPGIIRQEGSGFFSSVFWGARRFVCDLYNGVWEKYARERPFNIYDFRVFIAESQKHMVLYVEVPELPGQEELCNCALAFAGDVSDSDTVDIRAYQTRKHRIDGRHVILEVFDTEGRAACTASMSEAESTDAQNELVDLVWYMAFDEEGGYDMSELESPEEMLSHDRALREYYGMD